MKDLINKKLKGVAKLSQLFDLRRLVEDGDFHEAINKEIEERLKSNDTTGILEGSWYLDKRENRENSIRLYRVEHLPKEEEWAKYVDCISVYIDTGEPMYMWSQDTVAIVDIKKMKPIPKDIGDAVLRLYKDAHEEVKKTWHDAVANALDVINRPYW